MHIGFLYEMCAAAAAAASCIIFTKSKGVKKFQYNFKVTNLMKSISSSKSSYMQAGRQTDRQMDMKKPLCAFFQLFILNAHKTISIHPDMITSTIKTLI
jgi:hypothetical protein